MNLIDINRAIVHGGFSNEELNTIIDSVKYARSYLGQSVKQGLRVGDNVNFTSSRTGRNVTGVVTKIAIKFITVRTVDGLWKVPANMLTKVEEVTA